MVNYKGMPRATPAELEYLARVKQLPCCMCLEGEQTSITEVHHIVRTTRLGHYYTLPLCRDRHHKYVSRLRQFEQTLLKQVHETLGITDKPWPESKLLPR